MLMRAQLLPGSYSLRLLPGALLACSRAADVVLLEQKRWMSSDGSADGVVFALPSTLQPETQRLGVPEAFCRL